MPERALRYATLLLSCKTSDTLRHKHIRTGLDVPLGVLETIIELLTLRALDRSQLPHCVVGKLLHVFQDFGLSLSALDIGEENHICSLQKQCEGIRISATHIIIHLQCVVPVHNNQRLLWLALFQIPLAIIHATQHPANFTKALQPKACPTASSSSRDTKCPRVLAVLNLT